MEIQIEGDAVSLRLTRAEAERLGVAIAAGYETVSRSEYYIRTGLAQPVVRQIADLLTSVESSTQAASIGLDAGIEELENPRRPRPLA
jgi:hypothetical protein